MARSVGGEVHVLVIRDPYGNWGLPKGHLQEGESSAEAALREVAEEAGLSDLTLGVELGTIDWYFRTAERLIHKFCVFYLMGSSSGDPTPEVAEGITECTWVPISEVEDRIDYDNAREVVRKAKDLLRDGERLPSPTEDGPSEGA